MEKSNDTKDSKNAQVPKRPHRSDECWVGIELEKIHQYLDAIEEYCDVLEKSLDEAVFDVECRDCSYCNDETDEKCRACLKSRWLRSAYSKVKKEKLETQYDALEKALDEACKSLQEAGIGTTCDEEHYRQCMENHCSNTCRYARPLTEEEWKELLMEKAERSLSNNDGD